ncbi:MAG TPA: hypothetical protein VFF95_06485 [Candidatus Binatus sp.]|nr:hypothetical protein [Candidatus Binatus sp.]
MHRIFIAATVVCFVAATAAAQTKVSGTTQCGQPDTQHVIPVGDLPDHSLALLQVKCTYTKPMEIAGAKSVSTVITITNEVSGDTVRARGYQVATMDSGDKVFVSHEGTGTPEGQDGTWAITGGTGKLKGLKGKGTYTCSSSGCDVAGEYQLAK